MKVKSINIPEWQQFVQGLPVHSFFQLPIWSHVYEETYSECEIATKLFVFDDDVQVILPLVKTHRFGFEILESLPLAGYGGFLWNKRPSEAQVRKILKHLLTRKVLYLGIYLSPWDDENRELLETSRLLDKRPAFTHVMELDPGHQWLWENSLDAKCRNQVRKAIKSGVTIELAKNNDQIKTFYDIYLATVQRWDNIQGNVRPYSFFENLSQIGDDMFRIYLAKYEDKYISGAIMIYDDNGCDYWMGAMLKEYGKYCPNNLLINEVIKDACDRGIRLFNFGSSAGLPSVQKFKESFGAKKLDFDLFLHESPVLRLYKKLKSFGSFQRA